MSGASNTLAREFLTDVHQLCSAVAQRVEAREEDEEESHMVALGEYLVRGRGFLLLSTLDAIIDQVRKSKSSALLFQSFASKPDNIYLDKPKILAALEVSKSSHRNIFSQPNIKHFELHQIIGRS